MNFRWLLISLLLALPCVCRAESFTITDPSGNVQLQFNLPRSPEVLDSSNGEYFVTSGSSDDFGTLLIGFGSPDYFAQLVLGSSFGLVYFNAPQLYTGSEATPTLIDGTFDLTSLEGLSYTLNITSDTAGTPEPSCLMLCATGGALLAGALGFRRSRPALS